MIKKLDLREEHGRSQRELAAEERTGGELQPVTPPFQSYIFKAGGADGNHIVCRTWDGHDQGNEDVLMSLPLNIQRRFQPEGYTYSDFQNRTRDSDGRVEKIEPQYVQDETVIIAAHVEGTTGPHEPGEGEDEPDPEPTLIVMQPFQFWAKAC